MFEIKSFIVVVLLLMCIYRKRYIFVRNKINEVYVIE